MQVQALSVFTVYADIGDDYAMNSCELTASITEIANVLSVIGQQIRLVRWRRLPNWAIHCLPCHH